MRFCLLETKKWVFVSIKISAITFANTSENFQRDHLKSINKNFEFLGQQLNSDLYKKA